MRVANFLFGSILALLLHFHSALAADTVLTVIDVDGKSHPFTTDDIAALPQRTLKATAHGVENEFTGVSLVDLLQAAGIEFGEKLRGKRASDVALVEAADGYRTVFALLEIDPATTDKVVLVAEKKDGQPLGEKEGPLRLVVPDEKRPVRWARMIKTIRIVPLKELPVVGEAAAGGH
jgi:hypothetical protein